MTDLPHDDDLDHLVDDDPADDLPTDPAELLGVPAADPDGLDVGFDVGALLSGLAGDAGGAGIMGSMVEGLQRVQEARAATYEGVSGGGAVRIRATGGMEFEAVELRPDVVEQGDPELVADLVLAALRDLGAKQLAAQTEAMGDMGDLGGLGGALG